LYEITGVEVYLPEPNFFNINLTFVDGNGFIYEDNDYIISLIIDKYDKPPTKTSELTNDGEDGVHPFITAQDIPPAASTLQDVVNNGNGISNYGGLGTADIQSTNFSNNRTLYLNNNSYPTIRLVDNGNASHNLTIDLDTLNLNGTSYNWSSIVSGVPQNLQGVTDLGNTTTNDIVLNSTVGKYGDYTAQNTIRDIGSVLTYLGGTPDGDFYANYDVQNFSLSRELGSYSSQLIGEAGRLSLSSNDTSDNIYNGAINIYANDGAGSPYLQLYNKIAKSGYFKVTNLTNNITLQFPDKATGTYTIATTADIPSLSGTTNYIPKFTGTNSIGDSNILESSGVTYINYSSRSLLDGNTYMSIQRAQSQIDIVLGNSDISQVSSIWSDNTSGLELKSKGSLSFKAGSTYTEGINVATTGKLIFTQTPDTGTTSDKLLLRDSSGNVKQISYPTIGTWGGLNYPTWTTGTPFVKMTAAGTFALDTNTYLTSITSSDVTTALGYTPVTNARTLTINGTTYDLTSDRSWTIATGTGTVTSVGMTVPSAFSVTPSSITTSGTFAITGAGVVSQYVRGDGTLANFPTSTGGGASVSYYLNGSVSQGTLGGVAYKEMNSVPIIGTGTDFTINADGYIAQFITDVGDPNKLLIPAGNWNFETYFSASSGGGSPRFYIELYKYDGAIFTLITSNSATPEYITGGTAIDLYFTAIAVPPTTLLATDRLAVRFYVIHSGRTITMHTENSHLSQIITTFSTGLNDLNGLTSQAQYFATGTTGTDFAIVSTGTSHTFNLPNASATARGVITTEVQTLAGAKTFSTAPILSSLTASQILALDASKNIQTLDTATYPSLTELSYVKGVTSSIQTQFNNLAFSQSGLTAYTGTITWSGTTAPSGTTNFSYNWTKIGNMVTLNISLLYGTAGTLVSSVVMTLPAGAPTPIKPTGFSGASNLLYQASGKMSNSVTSTTVVNSHAVLRSNAANNGFEIYVGQTTGTNTLATATVIYFTA
jgi:hypothetical protein